MKALLNNFLTGLFFIGSMGLVNAQCPNNNIQFGTSNAPTTVGVTVTLSSCMYGGEYRLVNNMVAGSQYRFETCGDSDFDTQITIYDAVTGAFLGYNDDFCGLQSAVTIVSNGNPVRVLIDRYNCGSQSSCMTLRATRITGGAPPPDPCDDIVALSCGSSEPFSLSGSGAWNPPGPWGTPGEEQVYEFTPTVSGPHSIVVTNSGFYVDLFIKTGSCGPSGWTYIDDIFSSGTNTVNLNAGTTYYFLIDDENTSQSSGTITVNCPTTPVADPCDDVVALSCGSSEPFSLSGSGAWNPPGPWGTPGEEQVYVFTPTVSGSHSIVVTNSGFYVDLFIKTGSCGPTGWTYIDDIFSSGTNSVNLNAGTTYYFLIDDENTSPSNGTITVNCPTPTPDPCENITPVNCDNTYNYSISNGSGLFNGNGPWSTPGREVIYSYTAPLSGSYTINMTNNGSGWVDLFYRSGSACSGSGWTYIDDVFSSSSNSVQLTAGVTYLFLLDDEDQNGSTGNFEIECPCIPPPNGIDGSYVLSGDYTINGNTDGACNDCSFRSSEDQTWEITIPCPGTYTFETCGLATWDTYLYLSSAPCSGILALNDDNCGLRSRITYNFASAGTYYVTVEGFSSSSAGSYGLEITRSCDLSASLSPVVLACDYNITCNGGSDGKVNVNASGCGNLEYLWSNGSTGSSLLDVPAGTYSVTITDDWGCSTVGEVTLTEPDPMVVDAGNDQVVYYGYAPLSCVDVDATATGGCPGYDYEWTATGGNVISTTDNLTDCPTVSTQYELEVTDQNGCTATDFLSVCVIDVRCWAGNSSNQKVEMCQVPPGNPANAHTICIDESAVPAHLAIGCTLGACEEADDCNNAAKSSTFESYMPVEVSVSPNPFTNEVEIYLNVREKDDYTISIFDTYGKKVAEVHQGTLEAYEYNSYRVSLAHLAPGVYIVGVDNGKSQHVNARIIKQ